MRDVIIVGGGPAGLYASLLLSQRGCDVALFEEHSEPGEPVHCTGVLASEAYDELDHIPRDAVLNALTAVRFFAPSGDIVGYTTTGVEALVVDRRHFDRDLYLCARASGVTMVPGHRVTDVVPDRNYVTVSVAGRQAVRAGACILACGANYALQQRLGFGRPTAFLQSAQVEWPAPPLDAVEVHFGEAVAPSGFAWVVPVQRGPSSFARVGLMCDRNAGEYFKSFVGRLGPRCGFDPRLCESAASIPRQKMLPLAPLRKTYADRVVAIGDAAGLVKATTGGGIYYSLVSAAISADVLEQALARDALGERELQLYQREWRRRLGPELKAQLRLRLLANRLTDLEINELFQLALTDGIMPIVRRTARFNHHRDLILSLLKHPPARRVLVRRLLTRRVAAAN